MNVPAHKIDTKNLHFDSRTTAFEQQQYCLVVIKLLCQLTRAVQQHRGATMAFIGGDYSFMERIASLQEDIPALLHLVKAQESANIVPIKQDALDSLFTNWDSILIGWQQDQIMHNFEFHSHLVDELKRMIRQSMQSFLAAPEMASHVSNFLPVMVDTIFDNIEQLAKLRGLSTNAAIVKACGQESHARIAFLLKEIPEQQRLLLNSFDEIATSVNVNPIKESIKQHNKALHRLLLSIQIQILDSPDISISGNALFDIATDIINSRWNALNHCIQQIDEAFFNQLLK